jgi:hypothetical protein
MCDPRKDTELDERLKGVYGRLHVHAFKLATVWLLAVGLLFAFGQTTAGLVLGAVLVGVCVLNTTTNFCVPSTLLGIWWRRHGGGTPTIQPS